jgi:hypothetical protein
MNKEDIIRMAQEAGWSVRGGFVMPTHAGHITHELERFAALVASNEREACAKICDEFCYGSTKILVEKAIRARGQA